MYGYTTNFAGGNGQYGYTYQVTGGRVDSSGNYRY